MLISITRVFINIGSVFSFFILWVPNQGHHRHRFIYRVLVVLSFHCHMAEGD